MRTPINKTRSRRGGWILVEILIAIGVMGMLIGGLAVAEQSTRAANAFYITRQRCISAGQAQLDSLAIRGRPIAEADMKRLWPGVKTELSAADGQGQWQGLRRVTVVATGLYSGPEVKLELSRYYDQPVEVQP